MDLREASAGGYELGRLATPCAGFPRGQYVAVWREGEVRRRYRLGICLSRPVAEGEAALLRFVRQRQAAILEGTGKTIGDIWAAYTRDREIEGKKTDILKYVWRSLSPTFAHLQPQDVEQTVDVAGQRRTVCHRYAYEREQAGKSRDTIWTELTRLRTALNWAAKRRHIAVAPIVWVPAAGKSRDTHLSQEEVIKLFRAIKSSHVRLAMVLAMTTTSRKGAILELQWPQVDFDAGKIDFRSQRERSILDASHKKGRAVVLMSRVARVFLEEAHRIRLTDHVIEYNAKPVGDIKKAIQRAVRAAGLEGRYIGLHALRHSTASWLADDQVDMRVIQRLMGHEDVGTTATIYAKQTTRVQADAINRIDDKVAKIVGGS